LPQQLVAGMGFWAAAALTGGVVEQAHILPNAGAEPIAVETASSTHSTDRKLRCLMKPS
jgi:hypothetical protein